MFEVLDFYSEKIDRNDILKSLGLKKNKYFIVSIHREENVDNPENLHKVLSILNQLAEGFHIPIIVSTHPRTQKRMAGLTDLVLDSRIQFLKPFGFSSYVKLQKDSLCAISDSGTISEESAILSFPAITVRNSMERPEALDAGTIILTGFDPETIINSVNVVINEHTQSAYEMIPREYQIPNTSWRVLKLILGTARLSNKWNGIEEIKR